MHIEINQTIDFREEQESFSNFIYEDENQYLRVLKNGNELNLVHFNSFPSLKLVINSEVSPMLFQKQNNCFVGRSLTCRFGPKNYRDSIKNQITYFLHPSNIHLQLKTECVKKINCISTCIQSHYHKLQDKNSKFSLIKFFGSFFQSTVNFSFYNTKNYCKLNNDIFNKIEMSENTLSILGDDGNRLIEIKFYKHQQNDNCILNFFHKSKQFFAFDLYSKDKEQNCFDIVYLEKLRNIQSVYSEYGKIITIQIFGQVKMYTYLLYKQLNKFINNDSISVLVTYEALLLCFFLLLLAIFISIKKFIGKEKVWTQKSNADYINDNNSKVNSSLQTALVISNIPMFYLFAMVIPTTWTGIDFTGNIIQNITLSCKDFVLLTTPLFIISPGRILLTLSFALTGLLNVRNSKKQINIGSIVQSIAFAILISIIVGHIDEPIMSSIFLAMLFVNKTFMFLIIKFLFNINVSSNFGSI